MPHAKINDLDLYYEVSGQGEPLLLISGFGADHLSWQLVGPKLSEQFQVITFDNRGAGQTTVPDTNYTIEQMADDAAALLEHLNIQKAHILGNSMGGYIVQSLYLRHPDKVKTITISNSVSRSDTAFHLAADAQLELIKANAPATSLIKNMLAWCFSYEFLKANTDMLIQLNLQNPYPFSITGYEGQRAALRKFDNTDHLQKIDAPVLVIGSDEDLIFLERDIKALADNLPNAKYHCFKGSGHLPHIEQPNEYVDVIKAFLSQHPI